MYLYISLLKDSKSTATYALWNVDVAIPRYKSALCVWSQNLRYQIAKKKSPSERKECVTYCHTVHRWNWIVWKRKKNSKWKMNPLFLFLFRVCAPAARHWVPSRDISHNQLFLRAAWKEHNGYNKVGFRVY